MNADPEGSAGFSSRGSITSRELGRRERDFLIGASIALSLFFIEAGVAEILIGSDIACREALSGLRLPPDPFTACQAEWMWFMLRAVARGWGWLFNNNIVPLLAWLSMGAYYALAGGISAQLDRRNSLLLLLLIQIGTVAIIAGLAYLRQFIA